MFYSKNIRVNPRLPAQTGSIQNQGSKKSFTLVELLVVVAILGLLAAILLPAINHARAKARDSRRMADIDTIRKALEMQMTSEGFYLDADGFSPDYEAKCLYNCGGDCSSLLSYISELPSDPLGSSRQCYLINTDGKNFRIAAKLETTNEKAQNDGGIYPQFFEGYDTADQMPLTNYGSDSVWPDKTYLDANYNNLIGWWSIEEASWNGITDEVTDFSNQDNDGAAADDATTTVTNCISGRCGTFDGSLDCVNTSSFLIGENDITLLAWIKMSTPGGIISKDGDFVFRVESTYLRVYLYGETPTPGYKNGVANVLDDVWHLAGFTYDSSSKILKIYLDGVEDATHTSITSTFSQNSVFRIARFSSVYFTGKIDDVRLYNEALSPGEICARCKTYKSAAFCNNCSE